MIKNIAIFASGSGTNTENIANYFKTKGLISINLIVTNKKDALVIQRAKNLGIASVVIEKSAWSNEAKVTAILAKYKIDLIVLAGFLLKVPEYLIKSYPNRIINIHPALLPKHGGKGMYGDFVHESVYQSKDKETGITIHYCNENYDEGNILFQAKCTIHPQDTPASIAQKVHQLEYQHYPVVLENLIHKLNSKSF